MPYLLQVRETTEVCDGDELCVLQPFGATLLYTIEMTVSYIIMHFMIIHCRNGALFIRQRVFRKQI